MRVKLTKRNIDKLCLPPAPGELNGEGKPRRQKVYMDDELKGFGLRVGRGSKAFFAQGSIKGRSVRVTVGRLGDKDLDDPKGEKTFTPDHARDRAMFRLAQMRNGIDPREAERQVEVEEEADRREEEWRRFTLGDAIDEHVANMVAEGCAERSMSQIPEELGRHCPDWLDRPLVEIRRADAIDRHRAIEAQSGKWVAHRVRAQLRACWNSARDRFDELPDHPFRIKRRKKLRRRREPILWGDLPGYWSKVAALPNPIRRDLRTFILLTGLRSEDARTVRWEHVNLGGEAVTRRLPMRNREVSVEIPPGCIHRPKPKGGEDRSFTVPLSAYVLELLARRRMDNRVHFGDDHGWVFPTRDMKGCVTHVKEPKEQKLVRDEDGRKRKVVYLPSPHRLRDTFATAGHEEVGLNQFDLKILMNHVLSEGDVTEGYIRPSVEHLRACQEKVTAFLLKRAKRKVA